MKAKSEFLRKNKSVKNFRTKTLKHIQRKANSSGNGSSCLYVELNWLSWWLKQWKWTGQSWRNLPGELKFCIQNILVAGHGCPLVSPFLRTLTWVLLMECSGCHCMVHKVKTWKLQIPSVCLLGSSTGCKCKETRSLLQHSTLLRILLESHQRQVQEPARANCLAKTFAIELAFG